MKNRWLLRALSMAALACWPLVPAGGTTAGPVWERDLVVFQENPDTVGPWQADERLKGRFAEGYPDDAAIVFASDDPAIQGELMWATLIDYDEPTDRYLGVVLNEPKALPGVRAGDNAVFVFDTGLQALRALRVEGRFDWAGIPPRAREGDVAALYDGIRSYRVGLAAGDQAALSACVDKLAPIVDGLDSHGSDEDRFLARYVLARCHADLYESDAAIREFQAALALRPDDFDTHMALLAEYSLKVHTPDTPDQEAWESLFLEKLTLVRERFPHRAFAHALLSVIFDPKNAGDLSGLSEGELAYRKKFGFGVIRYRRR